jgi:hypothetical protein
MFRGIRAANQHRPLARDDPMAPRAPSRIRQQEQLVKEGKGRHVPPSTDDPRPGELARAKGRTLDSYRVGATPILERFFERAFGSS